MFGPLLLLMQLSISPVRADSLLMKSMSAFHALQDYQCTLVSHMIKGKKTEDRVYLYKFMKPHWIYMKVIKGKDKGAEIIYNPETGKIRAHKGGLLSKIKLTLKPTDKKVLSIRGHRVDKTDFGSILSAWLKVKDRAKVVGLGGKVDNIPCTVLEVDGLNPAEWNGANRAKIYIRMDNYLPYVREEYEGDTLVHRAVYKNLKINVGLTKDDFKM